MAWVDDDDQYDSGPNAYETLRNVEESRFLRRGGRRYLDARHNVSTSQRPGPLLRKLRANEVVEVMDWQVPRGARDGEVRNVRCRVCPDGRVIEDVKS
jgi:hypothetical protein